MWARPGSDSDSREIVIESLLLTECRLASVADFLCLMHLLSCARCRQAQYRERRQPKTCLRSPRSSPTLPWATCCWAPWDCSCSSTCGWRGTMESWKRSWLPWLARIKSFFALHKCCGRFNLPSEPPMLLLGNQGEFLMGKVHVSHSFVNYYNRMKKKTKWEQLILSLQRWGTWCMIYFKTTSFARMSVYYEGTEPLLFPLDPELIRRIMVTDFDHFMNFGFFPEMIENMPVNSFGLATATNERWKSLKATISPAFTLKSIKTFVPALNKVRQAAFVNLYISLSASTRLMRFHFRQSAYSPGYHQTSPAGQSYWLTLGSISPDAFGLPWHPGHSAGWGDTFYDSPKPPVTDSFFEPLMTTVVFVSCQSCENLLGEVKSSCVWRLSSFVGSNETDVFTSAQPPPPPSLITRSDNDPVTLGKNLTHSFAQIACRAADNIGDQAVAGTPVDIERLVSNFTMDCIARLVFSMDVGTIENPNNEFAKMGNGFIQMWRLKNNGLLPNW